MKITRREALKGVAAGAALTTAAGCGAAATEQASADPIDHLSSMTADLPPIPDGEFERRIEKARRLMREQGFQAFYAESGATLQYFTDVAWGRSERMFAVVIPFDGELAFVCPAFEEGRARERIRAADADVRTWEEQESPYERVGQILADRGLRTGRIAVDPRTRLFLISGMRGQAPVYQFEDGRTVSEGCRRTKSAVELELMELANVITKKAYAAALAGLKGGMSEAELAGRISRAHSRLGASGGAMVLFGPNAALPHGSQNKKPLREGDIVLVDGGCGVNGYRSDVSRTTVFGEPDDKQREVWQLVRDAQTAVLEAAGPGVACQEMDRVARKVVADGGYGPGYRYFTHRVGHGIGLEGHEVPYLVEGNTLPMEPGMTFSDEPGIYILGEWGVRHEDIMVITEDGARILGPRTESIERPV